MKTSAVRTFGIITVSLAVIILYGLAIALLGMTIVQPAWIVGSSIIVAVATALPIAKKWKSLTATDNMAINAICHIVAVTGLCMATILGVNYFVRDRTETVTVRAEIVKIYSETRHRMKRVARNRYTRGEPYKIYFMDVRLPDGCIRKRSISPERYNRYARYSHQHRERPDSIDLYLTRGALGMTIIERN